jgi:hypothetical protein
MYKSIVLLAAFCCISAHAEWYQVKSVESYNRIVAFKPNEPANEIKVRIKNLENIEDIQMGRSKVLLSGKSAQDLARDTLEGQLVWMENLAEDSGIYVGNVFPSYEQVVRGFANQRMVGGQTITPAIKSKLQQIAKRMLQCMNSSDTLDDPAVSKRVNQYAAAIQSGHTGTSININNIEMANMDGGAKMSLNIRGFEGLSPFTYDDCYLHDYLKGIFVYEALYWFKYTGQYLPTNIQEIYVNWLVQYQSANPQQGKILEQKIRDMVVRSELYKDFIFDD